jgi:hypothetical protein
VWSTAFAAVTRPVALHATGSVQIKGLPFTSLSTANSHSPAWIGYFDQLTTSVIAIYAFIQPSKLQRRNHRHKWSILKQYFEGVRITEIDADWLDRFKAKRTTDADIAPSTLKKDFVFIRLV